MAQRIRHQPEPTPPKHGLLAVGITELDDAEGYRNMLSALAKELNPVGTIEMFLVESAAVDMIRLRRAMRLEGEHITGELNPPIYKHYRPPADVDPGLPAAMKLAGVQSLAIFQRYKGAALQRLFRILHEIERLLRMRHGEQLPSPESGKTISRSPPEMFFVSVLEITTLANDILLTPSDSRGYAQTDRLDFAQETKLGLCTERSSTVYELNLSSSQRLWLRCLILLFRPAATLPSLASHGVADSRA